MNERYNLVKIKTKNFWSSEKEKEHPVEKVFKNAREMTDRTPLWSQSRKFFKCDIFKKIKRNFVWNYYKKVLTLFPWNQFSVGAVSCRNGTNKKRVITSQKLVSRAINCPKYNNVFNLAIVAVDESKVISNHFDATSLTNDEKL